METTRGGGKFGQRKKAGVAHYGWKADKRVKNDVAPVVKLTGHSKSLGPRRKTIQKDIALMKELNIFWETLT